jgi:AhpD family alkylhydroperoxidase
MTEYVFENIRFDPDRSEFHDLAKGLAERFGYTADLRIDRRLANLLRIRVAQLNPCSYCLILHTRVALDSGIDPSLTAHLASWRQSGMFSAAETAALAYCEALTSYDHARFDQIHRGLALFFDEVEIAEIAAVVINMNVWTRLKLAQGATPVPNVEMSPGDGSR